LGRIEREEMKKKEDNKKYYFVEVKQMQYFEIEVNAKESPLTEEVFFDKYYSMDNCEMDTTVEEIKEVDRLWTL
jgi:hypothetical protein